MKMNVVFEMFSKSSWVKTVPMKSAPINERTGMLSRPNLMFHGMRYGRWSDGSMNLSRITDRWAEQKAKVAASEYTAAIRSISLLPATRPGRTRRAATIPKTIIDTYDVLYF